MRKLFFTTLWIVLFGIGFCGAEEFSLCKISDWYPKKGMIQSNDKTIRVAGRNLLLSEQFFSYDNSKSYRILGEFKAAPGTPDNYVRVGVQLYGDDKKLLCYHYVYTVADSDTELVADVKATDTRIMIADGAKWQIKNRYVVAFHTDPDGKDLPNRNIIQQAPVKIQQALAGWEVVFAKPVGVDLKNGTRVRLHRKGSYFRYAGHGSTTVGLTNLECTGLLREPGVKFFRVIVHANAEKLKSGDEVPALEMTNVRLEIK